MDAGSGLRDVVGATAFPAGIALAATFDAELAQENGRAVGTEARSAGFGVLLGPTLDLARDPRGGRIPEGFAKTRSCRHDCAGHVTEPRTPT